MCFFIVIKAEQSNYTHQRKQPILRASIRLQSIPLPLECSALIYIRAHYVTDKSITAHEKQQCCGPCSTTTRAFSAIL